MKIEKLSQCLAKNGGHAWIDDKKRVNVVFGAGGKVYSYRSMTIYQVAEHLGLIPTWNVVDESGRIGALLMDGNASVIGYAGCTDTLNHMTMAEYLGDTRHVQSDTAGRDEYDRELSIYQVGDRPTW